MPTVEDGSAFMKGFWQKMPPPKDADAFAYVHPNAKVSGNSSGRLSILAYCLVLWAAIQAVINIFKGDVDTSYDISIMQHGKITLPRELAVVIKYHNTPVYDPSLITLKAESRTIYESDTNPDKPRGNFPIEIKDCVIGEGEFYSPIPAKCLTYDKDNWNVAGSYTDKVYKYLQIYITPCTDEIFNGTYVAVQFCADQANITNFFFAENSRVNVALYMKSQEDLNTWKWSSPAYSTVAKKWAGIETYFRRVEMERYGWMSLMTGKAIWSAFTMNERRESPIEVDEYGRYGEVLKYYLRADDHAVHVVHTRYGFVQAVELIGSSWSFLGVTIGVLCTILNMRTVQLQKQDARGATVVQVQGP